MKIATRITAPIIAAGVFAMGNISKPAVAEPIQSFTANHRLENTPTRRASGEDGYRLICRPDGSSEMHPNLVEGARRAIGKDIDLMLKKLNEFTLHLSYNVGGQSISSKEIRLQKSAVQSWWPKNEKPNSVAGFVQAISKALCSELLQQHPNQIITIKELRVIPPSRPTPLPEPRIEQVDRR